MSSESFDWYDEESDHTVEEPPKYSEDLETFGYVCRVIESVTLYSGIVLISLSLIMYIFEAYRKSSVMGIPLTVSMVGSGVVLMSLLPISRSVSFIFSITRIFELIYHDKRSRMFKELVSLLAWSTFSLNFVAINKVRILPVYPYPYVHGAFCVIEMILFTMACNVVVIDRLHAYFIKRMLSGRIKAVRKSESIMAAMKKYLYCTSSSSVFDGEDVSVDTAVNVSESESFASSGNELGATSLRMMDKIMQIGEPEVSTLYGAITLARDVFTKASRDGRTLTYEDFRSIFPDVSMAVRVFSSIDITDSKVVKKREFRDKVVSFFRERSNLMRHFEITNHFVDIVEGILYGVLIGADLLFALVIFGYSLGDILSFVLSSALMFSFLISGLVRNIFLDVIFVISHPFDVDDEILIDGKEYKVFSMGVGTTSFLLRNGGKISFMNSSLCNKKIVNMTRAPEKKLEFRLALEPSITGGKMCDLKRSILEYLSERSTDYHGSFTIQSSAGSNGSINEADCIISLRYKERVSHQKRLKMRIEFIGFLKSALNNLQNSGMTQLADRV